MLPITRKRSKVGYCCSAYVRKASHMSSASQSNYSPKVAKIKTTLRRSVPNRVKGSVFHDFNVWNMIRTERDFVFQFSIPYRRTCHCILPTGYLSLLLGTWVEICYTESEKYCCIIIFCAEFRATCMVRALRISESRFSGPLGALIRCRKQPEQGGRIDIQTDGSLSSAVGVAAVRWREWSWKQGVCVCYDAFEIVYFTRRRPIRSKLRLLGC